MVAISILIRTTGRQAALRDALESLRGQDFKDFEAVVVEDGPATLGAFLLGYTDFPVCYEALGKNRGRSHAGNRALTLAQGEYCLFLDEDDALYPTHLSSLYRVLSAAGRAVAYSWSEERPAERAPDGSITRTGRFKRTRRERFSPLCLVAGNFLPINAVLFSRRLFTRAGGFDEDIDCLEDWLLWLRFVAIEPDWICVPRATAIYHVPLERARRRRAFKEWQPKVHERMRAIVAAWPVETLYRDIRGHFRLALFLRKLYYHFTGYI